MQKIQSYLKKNPHIAISVPTVLCFIQFLSTIFTSFRAGTFDSNTLNQLLSSADGFESVTLFVIMVILKKNKD